MENLEDAWDARVEAITGKLPEWGASAVRWLRKPSRRLIRAGAAILLILGGLLSFLPVLGIWMLPLGLALMAEDVPSMKPRLERASRWVERRWQAWFGSPPEGAGSGREAGVRPPSGA